MSAKLLIILSCLPFFLQCQAQDPNPNNTSSTAYEELASKGFPSGLLPNSVAAYSMNKTSGDFLVELHGQCDIVLPPDNYPASFSRTIKGRLAEGYIHGLTGIRVKAFFRWWSITGIRIKGEKLVFEVGVASAEYPSANFDESPDCGLTKHSSS